MDFFDLGDTPQSNGGFAPGNSENSSPRNRRHLPVVAAGALGRELHRHLAVLKQLMLGDCKVAHDIRMAPLNGSG